MPLPCASGPCHFPAESRGADPDSGISLRGGEHKTPSGTDSNVFWDSGRPGGRAAVNSCMCTSFILYQS